MKFLSRIILVVAIVGVMCTYMGAKDTISLAKDPIDMAEVDWGTLKKGDHVQITIDVVWDVLYTETTTESTYGITTDEYESARGYVIPHLYIDNQGYYNIDYFIGLRLNSAKNYAVVEQILDETNEWYFDTTGTVDYGMTTFYMDGVLDKMSSEEEDLMMEYLIDYCGYSRTEAEKMICPFMIETRNEGAVHITLIIGLIADAILIVGIIYIVISKKKEKEMFSGSRYMGVVPTGSTDIYGGSNYGGSNFGGTNTYDSNNSYGAQQEEKYDGPWQPYQ